MVGQYEPPEDEAAAEQTMVIHDARLEQKFAQVPYEVVFMHGLSRDAKHTYTVLLSYAWKHNKCFPGMLTLCKDLEASEPTARKFLRELQDCRLIRIQRRGLQRTNLYHLLPVGDAYVPERAAVEVWLRSTLQHINKRAARLGAAGTLSLQEWNELCDRHGNMCLICGATERLVPDHVTPLAKGGLNVIANIQPLCDSCNNRKRDTIADHRPRPDRKLVLFPERTPVFVQDQTGVCTQDATPAFTPTKEEEYTEGSIPREKNTTAHAVVADVTTPTHVGVGADAPPPAQKRRRATSKEKPDAAATTGADLLIDELREALGCATVGAKTREKWAAALRATLSECTPAERSRFVRWLVSNGYWCMGTVFKLSGQLEAEAEAWLMAGKPERKPSVQSKGNGTMPAPLPDPDAPPRWMKEDPRIIDRDRDRNNDRFIRHWGNPPFLMNDEERAAAGVTAW